MRATPTAVRRRLESEGYPAQRADLCIQTILSEDGKKEYNVFRKFIIVTQSGNNDQTAYDEEIQILSRQLDDKIIDEDEYMKFGSL
jgi:hypothetical protein